MQYIERYTESIDWVTLFLVGCIVLFSIAKYAYPKRFEEFVMLPVNNKYFLVHGKSDDIKHPFNLLLFVTQVISVSLFIFLLFKTEYPETLIKFLIEKIVGSIFTIDPLVNNYLYQKLSYRNLLAIAIFIGNLIFFYVLEPTKSSLFIFIIIIVILNCIALLYSYKIIGSLILHNFFYFILYLCGLEISPYIILYKALQ